MSDQNPRQFDADDLNGSANPTGVVTHAEPSTVDADDVTNEPTGAVTPGSSEAPQPETAGTVTVTKPEEGETPVVDTKVVTPPAPPSTVTATTAETA